jgi:hypothetical protein
MQAFFYARIFIWRHAGVAPKNNAALAACILGYAAGSSLKLYSIFGVPVAFLLLRLF